MPLKWLNFLKAYVVSIGSYLGRVAHLETGDGASVETIGQQKNRSDQGPIGVEAVVPVLTVSVEGTDTSTVDIDILAANHPLGSRELVIVCEEKRQPMVAIVAEVECASQGNVNVLEKAKIHRRAYIVFAVEDSGTAVVALVHGCEDLGGVIATLGTAGLHEACLAARGELRERLVGLDGPGLNIGARDEVASQNSVGQSRSGHGEW